MPRLRCKNGIDFSGIDSYNAFLLIDDDTDGIWLPLVVFFGALAILCGL